MFLIPNNSSGLIKKINLVDLVILLTFALFASIYQINRSSGNNSFLFYASDAESITCFAAALDHPEFFKGDEVLADQGNFNFYATLHIPLIRAIAKATGNYAFGYSSLVGLHIFLQALGFYLFGRVLFHSRFWASLLAVATLMYVPLAMGDFWGMYQDPLPRIAFQVFLPYLLAAVVFWRFKPKMWPWIMGFAGLSMYLHPASAPALAFSIWLGFWLFLPGSWGWIKRIAFMTFSGAVFLLGALPFSINYFKDYAQTPIGNSSLALDAMRYRMTEEFFNIPLAVKKFFFNLTFLRILIAGVIGAVYAWLFYRNERKKIALIGIWILGILITAVVIPLTQQLYNMNSTQGILTRNLRYLFPLALVFCLCPFVLFSRNTLNSRQRRIAMATGLLLVFTWSSRQMYKHILFLNETGYLMPSPEKTRQSQMLELLNALNRLTPPGSRILSLASFSDLTVRYHALRPLVYSFKDAASFSFTNHAKLVEWHEKAKEVKKLRENLAKISPDKINLALNLASKFQAEYLLIERKDFMDQTLLLNNGTLYYNDLFALVSVNLREKR